LCESECGDALVTVTLRHLYWSACAGKNRHLVKILDENYGWDNESTLEPRFPFWYVVKTFPRQIIGTLFVNLFLRFVFVSLR
jgi:hypothetical protein